MKGMLKNRYVHLVLAIIMLLLMYYSPKLVNNEAFHAADFTETLHAKEQQAETVLTGFQKMADTRVLFSFSNDYKQYSDEGIAFFILEKEQPVFWTDRNISLPRKLNNLDERGVLKLSNGWYEYILKKDHLKSYLALILVQHLSPINNKYFNRTMHESFGVGDHFQVQLEKGDAEIRSGNGQYLFSIAHQPHDESFTTQNNWLVVIFFVLGFLLLLSYLSKQFAAIPSLKKISALLVIGFILLVRVLLLYFNFFNSFFELELFSPSIYAQSAFLPSLGDLMISAVFYLVLVYYYSKAVKKTNAKSKGLALLSAIVIAVLPILLADLLQGLIINSKINFDVNYLLDLDAYSFIGIGSIVLLLIAAILFIKINVNHFIDQAFKRNHFLLIAWCFALVSVIIGHFFLEVSFFLTGWVLLVVIVFSFKTTPRTSFYRSALLIFLIAMTISYGFIHLSKQKEQTNKEFIAKKISKERDPVAEFLFEGVDEKLKSDTLLINNISNYWDNKERINEHIISKYFGGYWTKYDINIIYPCNELDSIMIEPDNINVNCLTFFNDKIERESGNPFGV
ncbi:MAG: hypothetical protein KDD41_12390, partial [Flavobacteriales bacterium]|nr:hypothetical protein [Flavobacteriales bacterium]